MSEAKNTKVEKNKKNELAEKLRYMRDRDREKVKGMFKFYEVPGGMMEFSYKAYKEDEVETFALVDGECYSIPLGVAKHLNNNGWYPEYSYVPGEANTQGNAAYSSLSQVGNPNKPNMMRMTKKIRRFSFQSLEFMDIEGLSSAGSPAQELVMVEKVA